MSPVGGEAENAVAVRLSDDLLRSVSLRVNVPPAAEPIVRPAADKGPGDSSSGLRVVDGEAAVSVVGNEHRADTRHLEEEAYISFVFCSGNKYFHTRFTEINAFFKGISEIEADPAGLTRSPAVLLFGRYFADLYRFVFSEGIGKSRFSAV